MCKQSNENKMENTYIRSCCVTHGLLTYCPWFGVVEIANYITFVENIHADVTHWKYSIIVIANIKKTGAGSLWYCRRLSGLTVVVGFQMICELKHRDFTDSNDSYWDGLSKITGKALLQNGPVIATHTTANDARGLRTVHDTLPYGVSDTCDVRNLWDVYWCAILLNSRRSCPFQNSTAESSACLEVKHGFKFRIKNCRRYDRYSNIGSYFQKRIMHCTRVSFPVWEIDLKSYQNI